MSNQDLLTQLKKLNKINPDAAWLKGNRELLLAQISNSGAETLSVWKMLLINFSSFSRVAVRPASTFAVFVILILGGGILSQRLVAQAQPNDSLYIARIISEQVRLNTTINTEARDQLALEFATSHAQDINAVLADPEFNKEENKEKVEKLNNSFKIEVENVKKRLDRLAVSSSLKKPELPASVPAVLEGELEAEIMIAESLKDGQGIELAENLPAPVSGATVTALVVLGNEPKNSETPVSPAAENNEEAESEEEIVSALEDAIADVSLEAEAKKLSSETDQLLADIQKLFDAREYGLVAEKLKEINKIIKK